ncbi:DsbA family protein [Micromonospora sp. NPDC050187]|uniref:DsbA family protein n=1 Tax=Micromonospora sp. NPDC050187 TaxID=3364277 RepID=UPI00379270FC
MEIEVYADVVCPWCYVGKRRLEQALAAYQGEVTLRYRPFQLDPSPVTAPRPLIEGLGAKFGGVERARQMADQVTGVAAGVGLKLDFDRAVTANTFDAHRLIRFADGKGRAADMIEALFRAHFTDGVDIGSRSALASLAATAGLDATEVRDFLDSDAGVAELRAELTEARSIGVTSVPTFVLAGKYAVSGAQEPETLLAALAEVERRESSAD